MTFKLERNNTTPQTIPHHLATTFLVDSAIRLFLFISVTIHNAIVSSAHSACALLTPVLSASSYVSATLTSMCVILFIFFNSLAWIFHFSTHETRSRFIRYSRTYKGALTTFYCMQNGACECMHGFINRTLAKALLCTILGLNLIHRLIECKPTHTVMCMHI